MLNKKRLRDPVTNGTCYGIAHSLVLAEQSPDSNILSDIHYYHRVSVVHPV